MASLEALQDRFQRTVVFLMRVRLNDRADALGKVLTALSGAGARAGEVNKVEHQARHIVYDIQVFAASDDQMAEVRTAAEGIDGVEVAGVIDLAMHTHRGGTCEMRTRAPIRSNTDLRIVYTPGVARVCRAIEADPAKAHDPDWQTAIDEGGARLDPMLPQEDLEQLLTATEAMADRPAETIIQRGSGWGALERKRREATGEGAGWPASLVFDDQSLTVEQTPWLELLEAGSMSEPPTDAIPPSFMIHGGWLEQLEAAVAGPAKDNWYAWLQLGIVRYSMLGDSADAAGAIEAWKRSLEIVETPWAHRNLGVAAWHAGDREESADRWLRAWQLHCGDTRLAKEASKVLIRTGRHDEFLEMLEILPDAVKADVRLDIYRIICLLEKDDPAFWPEVEAFLAKPHESVDTHEGEPTLSNIFYEFEARKLAAADGVDVSDELRQRVRDELTVPSHLDFRQIRDPAFDKAKDQGKR